MKQLNNSSTPKGRKVFKRRILFFSFFDFSSHCFDSGTYSLKRTVDQEIKQDNIEKEITTEKEKDGVREPPQKVQRYDWVARNQRHRLFLSGYAGRHRRSS